MKLAEYLEIKGWSPALFAKKCGLSHTTIHNIVYEIKNISLNTALTIQKATEGEVSFEDMAFIPAKQGYWPALKIKRRNKVKD